MKPEERTQSLVKADIYRILSKGFTYPDIDVIEDIGSIANELLDFPHLDRFFYGYIKEILPLLNTDDIRREYSRLFLKGTVPLCESSYNLSFDVIPRLSAFYSAFGLSPRSGESPDSISYELEFASFLSLKRALAECPEGREVVEEAYRSFLKEHLSGFVDGFFKRVKHMGPCPFYRVMVEFLKEFVGRELIEGGGG